MRESLLSVGIDVGTSTTQLVFSRLHIRNEAGAFSVPDFGISSKEVLYRSKVYFTPLLSEEVIDVQGLREIVDREYEAAGVEKNQVQTGAVIITGETARKENAREVLNALSGYAGDFVVATAGPALESVLAGKGAGAEAYSRNHGCSVVNLDIGGGTTNLALFENGELRDTGCLNVGGRLMKFRDGKCTYLSPVLRPYFNCEASPWEVAQFLTEILEEALGFREGNRYLGFITDKLCKPGDFLSFSGGVADLILHSRSEDFAYGDLGVLLGRAIRHSALWGEDRCVPSGETIRATVMGAGLHTTELSGSTIFYRNMEFPLKNLPVAHLTPEEELLPQEELIPRIRQRLDCLAPKDSPCVLSFRGLQNPKFAELCKLADTVALAMEDREALFLSPQRDMGKALGQAVHSLLPGKPLLCLDGLSLPEGTYLDVATPIAGGQVLPVVIKTIVL
ncbi:MAG: ethanolamine ammonia-lyase reactivating factor EutA [Oscillospiraceae bacterium]|nr:ethanolamine ammonia-lyase reactivating factor EutA [Oscillospiraceae bacterium]